MALKALSPKTPEGKALGLLAVAQRYSGLRMFFLRTSKLLLRGRKLGSLKDSKGLQATVEKFTPWESRIYENGKLIEERSVSSVEAYLGVKQEHH